MKNAIIALGIIIVAGIAAAFLLHFGGVEETTAEKVALGVLGCLPFIYQQVEKTALMKSSVTTQIPTLREYALNPLLLTIFGALAVLAPGFLFSGMLGYLGGLSGMPFSEVAVFLLLQLFITLPATFGVGLWIGRRARRYPLLSMLGTVTLFRILSIIIDYTLIPAEDYKNLFRMSIQETVPFQLTAIAVFTAIGASGVWRGRNTQVQSYVAYLTQLLPRDTQITVVELLHQEVSQSLGRPKTVNATAV
jgi:hypothetical protein